jgi:hypothetical protein
MVKERRHSAQGLVDEVCRLLAELAARPKATGFEPTGIMLHRLEQQLGACNDDLQWAIMRGVEDGRLAFVGAPAHMVCLREDGKQRTTRPPSSKVPKRKRVARISWARARKRAQHRQ